MRVLNSGPQCLYRPANGSSHKRGYYFILSFQHTFIPFYQQIRMKNRQTQYNLHIMY